MPMMFSLFATILLLFIEFVDSSSFLAETRATRLINRTIVDFPTECSIRVGDKDFTSKFYRLISCRYVRNLAQIYPYLLKYSNDINGLEIIDSNIDRWNTTEYRKLFRRFEFFIFHRTKFNQTESCPFNIIAKKLFYLHLIEFSPSLDNLVSHRSCLPLKRLHVLVLDQTPVGNANILLQFFPNLHLLRLNFSTLIQPLNSSYMSSFIYLHDFYFKVADNCHRCEYEWLKYAARDGNLLLFRVHPQSGCMDWHSHGGFLPWKDAPLCGSCSLPMIPSGQRCRMEDGITEYYCHAFYGRHSLFHPWTTQFDDKVSPTTIPPRPTSRPPHEFMKSKYTSPSIVQRLKREEKIISTTQSSWLSRLVVTRKPSNLYNRSSCPSIDDSLYRPKLGSEQPQLIEQLINISRQFISNCSSISCHMIRTNYSGPVCLKNGRTYSNLCDVVFALCIEELDVEHLQIDYFGSCVSHCSLVKRCFSDREICVMTPKPHCIRRERHCNGFSPVCDTFGKTFVNLCHLGNSLVWNQPRQIAYHGPCRIQRRCTADLCHSNEICVQTQDKYHYPVCLHCHRNHSLSSSSPSCPFELFCGDNQREYVNRCQLNDERCQTRTFIQISHTGPCQPADHNEQHR